MEITCQALPRCCNGALGGRRFRLPARRFKTAGGFPIAAIRGTARRPSIARNASRRQKPWHSARAASQTSPQEFEAEDFERTAADAIVFSPAAPSADPQGLARRDPGTRARTGSPDHRPAPSSVGPAGQPLSVPRSDGRPEQRPQYPRHRVSRMPRDVPRRGAAGTALAGRDAVRRRRVGDERKRQIRPGARLPGHYRQCRFPRRQPRQGHPRTAHHPFRRALSRHPQRRHLARRPEPADLHLRLRRGALCRPRLARGVCRAGAAQPVVRGVDVPLAVGRPDRSGARLPGNQDRAEPYRRRARRSAPMPTSARKSSRSGARRSTSSASSRTSTSSSAGSACRP